MKRTGESLPNRPFSEHSGRPAERKRGEHLLGHAAILTPDDLLRNPNHNDAQHAEAMRHVKETAIGSINYLLDEASVYQQELPDDTTPATHFIPPNEWIDRSKILMERYASIVADKDDDHDGWQAARHASIATAVDELGKKLDAYNEMHPTDDSSLVQLLEELRIEAARLDRADRSAYATNRFGHNFDMLNMYRDTFGEQLKEDYHEAVHAEIFMAGRGMLRHFESEVVATDSPIVDETVQRRADDNMRAEFQRFAKKLEDEFGNHALKEVGALTVSDCSDEVNVQALRNERTRQKLLNALELTVKAMRQDLSLPPETGESFPQHFPTGQLKNPPEVAELSRMLLIRLKQDIKEHVQF